MTLHDRVIQPSLLTAPDQATPSYPSPICVVEGRCPRAGRVVRGVPLVRLESRTYPITCQTCGRDGWFSETTREATAKDVRA